ncbi:MAG: NAD-dependent succinate-semialdehyde dehydrogenase [Planctomycetes bacterium]|nr:NAD-dependent succinate-semialdehyde dehydrogenase [Planctomycetota bacterium]
MKLQNQALFKEQCFINGQWLSEKSGASSTVSNPSTQEAIAEVPFMGASECSEAIAAADAALADWQALTAHQRSAYLMRWYQLIIENKEDLAILMTMEQGKPLAEARGEIEYGANFIEWFAQEGKRVHGDMIPAKSTSQRIMVLKQAIGVVAAITPWNFPSAMITRKCAPALAVGCTVVIKPAPDTPLSALALCELARQAGFPDGVINCLTGDAVAIGGELTSSSIVRKLSFTGSTAVGKLLLKQCADTVKKVSLELGGNAPFIVFSDADLDAAVLGAMACKFRNTGQTCVCANRFFIHQDIHDTFIEKFTVAIEALQVGDGFDQGVSQGPLINQAAFDKVSAHVANACEHGASLITGGSADTKGGTFFQPTLLTGIKPDMHMAQEETFGPVAGVMKFSNDDEVIQLANDTNVGLAAYIYTKDLSRAIRMAEALEYGMVGVNEGVISNEVAPFGGIKESGLGREGSHYGVEDFLELKYVLLGGI